MAAFSYFVLLFVFQLGEGFVELGIYSKLKDTQSLNASGQVNGWTTTGRPGLYSHATTGVAFSTVKVPVGGVYFASTILIFDSSLKISLKTSILVSSDSKRKTGLTSFEFSNSSITVSGLVQLATQDSLSVYIEITSGSTITIIQESTFFVQLLYSLSVYPSFQAVLSRDSEDMVAPNWRQIEGWISAVELQSGFSESVGTYCTSCDGVYSVEGNILLESTLPLNISAGIFLRSQSVISEAFSRGDRRRTVSLGGVFHLTKGDCIDLKTRSFNSSHKVLKDSGYSLFYLGTKAKYGESRRLNADAPTISTAGLHDINNWTVDGSRVHFQSSRGTMMTDSVSYKVQTHGNYLISGLVNTKSPTEKPMESIWLLIIINKTPASKFSDASIVVKKPISLMTSMFINGVLFLSVGDTVTLCIYQEGGTPITPLEGSLFSIVMVPKDWPGFSAVLDHNKNIAASGWQELAGWNSENTANGLYSFDGAFNTVTGRYVVPLEGTYIVSCVINVKGSPNKTLQVMIAVNGQVDQSTGLQSVQYSGEGSVSVPIIGTIRLLTGTYLSVFVHVDPGIQWMVGNYSSFTVTLNGGGEATNMAEVYRVKAETYNHTTIGWKEVKSWQSRDSFDQSHGNWDSTLSRFTPSEDGLYLISANLAVTSRAVSEFGAKIIPDGKINDFSGGQNYQRVQNLVTSPWSFTLPVSCVLKLTRSQFVSVFVTSFESISWSINVNSSLSIVFMSSLTNPNRGGMNAIAGYDSFANDKFIAVKRWKFSNRGSAYGLFKDQMVYNTNPDQIEFGNSGLYYIGYAVRASPTVVNNATYSIALCIGDSPKITLIRASKIAEVKKAYIHFGISTFGVLYLTKGQRVHFCISGGVSAYEIAENNVGFSLVKIVPRGTKPGLRQIANQDSPSSNDWLVVSDWTSGGMNSLYKHSKISSIGDKDVVVSRGTFFVSSLFLLNNNSTSSSGNFCIAENECNLCYFKSTSSAGGINLAGLLRFQSQQIIRTCVKGRAVSVARSAQFLPFANENSTFFYRHDTQVFYSAGVKSMTNWILKHEDSRKDIIIALRGLYILTVNIVLRSNTDTQLKVITESTTNSKSVKIPGLSTPNTWSKANEPLALGLSGLVHVETGGSLGIKVYSDSSTSWQTDSNATFSAGLVTTEASPQGVSLRIPRDSTATVTSDWMVVEGWVRVPLGLVSTSSMENQGHFVSSTTGVYVVMATLSVSVSIPNNKECTIELLLSIDGNVANSNRLIMTRSLKGQDGVKNRTATLSLSSSVYLSKWQAVYPMIRSSSQEKVVIFEDSSFYVVLVDKKQTFSQGCDNVGPRMIVHPQPFQKVVADSCKTVSLKCDAVADGKIAYKWLKNNELLTETNQNIVIENPELSDAGRYQCVAESSNVTVTSYPAVIEILDSRPVFTRSRYEVTVNETSSKLSLAVFNFTALTKTQEAANVSFIIESGNINGTFTIMPSISTGEVTLSNTKPLDYEQITKYQLLIKATNTDTRQSRYIHVTIDIRDVNDNFPVFQPQAYYASLPEEAWIGALITQVTAMDMDSGDNGKITYCILEGNTGQAFGIKSDNGLLFVNNTLDFKTLHFYNLSIEARDRGNPSLKSHDNAHVIIQIKDSNNHKPVFGSSKYNFSIHENAENGSVIGRVDASDEDQGRNGQISYSIEGSDNLFSVNHSSGEISLVGELDYETTQLYVLLIMAVDQGTHPRSAAALVYVRVQDVNDNHPICDPETYHVHVTEATSVGTEIIRVNAVDKDSGLNCRVNYTIIDGNTNGEFRVSPSGSIILSATLNREVVSDYNLSISLTDWGNPPKQSHKPCLVLVHVIDINDNFPRFLERKYNVTLLENVSIGHDVIRVQATDSDIGSNALVLYDFDRNCSSTPIDQSFAINATSGVIYTTKRIDFDTLTDKSIRLRVVAKDSGSPSLMSHVDVVVTVTDANDNYPQFQKSIYRANLIENKEIGYDVIRVHASDADSGRFGLITYYIEPTSHAFDINNTTGVIYTTVSFDYENLANESIRLRVAAKDGGSPALVSYVDVIIKLSDVNDNEPKFINLPSTVPINENTPENKTLFTAIAEDCEFGNNTELRYSIDSVHKNGDCLCRQDVFSMNSTSGELNVAKALPKNAITIYDVVIGVEDDGEPPLKSLGNLTVIVSDVNDISPKFQNKAYKKTFTTPPKKLSLLQTVQAEDYDHGNNSVIDYEIVDVNTTEHCKANFTILSNGSVYNDDDLRHGCTYNLLAMAKDRGEPPNKDTCHVVIVVKDVTDNNSGDKDAQFEEGKRCLDVYQPILITIIVVLVIVVVIFVVYVYRGGRTSKSQNISTELTKL